MQATTTKPAANEVRTTKSGIRVQRIRMLGGTPWYTFAAWEPSASFFSGAAHSTVTTFDDAPGAWFGKVSTGPLPADIAALPARTEKRATAVRAWFDSEYARAHAAIVEAFPEAAQGEKSGSEISMGGVA